MVKGFSKKYNFSLFGQFFCKHFYYITGFCDKKFNFCKFEIFLQILKVEHKSFLMMYHLSYLDIKHGIQRWGSVKLTPPHILVFQYPSNDRVKHSNKYKLEGQMRDSFKITITISTGQNCSPFDIFFSESKVQIIKLNFSKKSVNKHNFKYACFRFM